ncbi:hypothetical protein CVT24_004439, partial [Panaeolus cyanescens]
SAALESIYPPLTVSNSPYFALPFDSDHYLNPIVAMHVVIQCALLYVASSVMWRICKRLVIKTDLDYLPGPPAESFFKGVLGRIFDVKGWDYHRMIWNTYGSVTKLKGPLGVSCTTGVILGIFDNKVIGEFNLYLRSKSDASHIGEVSKNNDNDNRSEMNQSTLRLFFGNGLLGTLGEHHKKQRKLLNPVFSISHMREMIPMFYGITHKLETSLDNQIKDGPKEVDMLFWMGRTALELIGQSGFGHSFDDLSEDYNEHCYSSALKRLVPASFPLIFLRTYFLKPAVKIGSASFRHWIISYLPIPRLRILRDIVDVLHETSLQIYEDKKRRLIAGDEAVREQVGKGKDILSILMKQNMEADDEDRLDEDEIYAQISTFTFAGMDTTSNALSRTLWLMAKNPSVQSQLRDELREVQRKSGGDIPYDELVSLPLLDAVCRETLRLYTPVSFLTRQPVQDIHLPLSKPVQLTNGQTVSEILVPKGTKCIVSMMGSNRNVEIWGDDAEEWKPERWLTQMKDEVVDAKIPGIYSHLMTFGAGGRACIGFKFSQLEMKVVLATLVSRFEFSPGGEEIEWQMTGVVIPVLAHGDKTKPCMPHSLRWNFTRDLGLMETPAKAVGKDRPGLHTWATFRVASKRYVYVLPRKSFFDDGILFQVFFLVFSTLMDGITTAKCGRLENLLYTYDPKAMHHMLVKDQNVFQQSESLILQLNLCFGEGLLGTLGDHHKKQRKMLNPVFSTAHMREMIPIFYTISHQLEKSLLNQLSDGPKEIDMLFWIGRTALELIGQSGFGHSFDDLTEDYKEGYFSSALKGLVPASFRVAMLRTYFLKPALKIGTPAFRRAMISYLPIPALRELRDIVDILHGTSLEIYRYKKEAFERGDEAVAQQIGMGKDILSILMRANMEASDEDKLDEAEIHDQISTFTIAGMDTTSNALSRCIWLLAQHPDIQAKLRKEIKQAKASAGGDIGFDELVSLPYLDAVCRETLRLHSPVAQMVRMPNADIMLPLSRPVRLVDGRMIDEVFVKKGTKCIISVDGSNKNPELWGDDAHEWKPERWLGDLKAELISAKLPGIYSHLMTFGAGGRACIGFKFSQLEMKAVLATLVTSMEFGVSREIAWQMSTVAVPVVADGDRSVPQMPVWVKKVDLTGFDYFGLTLNYTWNEPDTSAAPLPEILPATYFPDRDAYPQPGLHPRGRHDDVTDPSYTGLHTNYGSTSAMPHVSLQGVSGGVQINTGDYRSGAPPRRSSQRSKTMNRVSSTDYSNLGDLGYLALDDASLYGGTGLTGGQSKSKSSSSSKSRPRPTEDDFIPSPLKHANTFSGSSAMDDRPPRHSKKKSSGSSDRSRPAQDSDFGPPPRAQTFHQSSYSTPDKSSKRYPRPGGQPSVFTNPLPIYEESEVGTQDSGSPVDSIFDKFPVLPKAPKPPPAIDHPDVARWRNP